TPAPAGPSRRWAAAMVTCTGCTSAPAAMTGGFGSMEPASTTASTNTPGRAERRFGGLARRRRHQLVARYTCQRMHNIKHGLLGGHARTWQSASCIREETDGTHDQ